MTLEESLEKRMLDPEFKTEYETLEPEFVAAQAAIDARRVSRNVQERLSEPPD